MQSSMQSMVCSMGFRDNVKLWLLVRAVLNSLTNVVLEGRKVVNISLVKPLKNINPDMNMVGYSYVFPVLGKVGCSDRILYWIQY